MKAIRVHKPGGPEGMVYKDVPDPQAGAGQAVVKVEAIGLNFAEVNRRRHADPCGEYSLAAAANTGRFRSGRARCSSRIRPPTPSGRAASPVSSPRAIT